MKLLRAASSLLTTVYLAAVLRLRPPAPREVKSILVLGYAAMGDFLFFLPTLKALRAAYPGARLVFLANRYVTTEELLPASGLADDIWLFDWEEPDAAAQQAAINRRIHEAGFDLAVLTLSSPAHFFQWGLRAVPLRAGHVREGLSLRQSWIAGEWARRAVLNRAAAIRKGSEPAAARNLRLLPVLGLSLPHPVPSPEVPLSEAHRAFARQAFSRLAAGRRRVGAHAGPPRSQYHKIWDPEKLGRLCAKLAKAWGAEIILVGGAEEEPGERKIRELVPAAVSWVGRASVLESFALIGGCDLFLASDTGLAKAAMTMGVPTVTFYGPTDPVELGAPWDAEKHLDIRTGIACSPCVRLGMAKAGVLNYLTCGHHDCLGRLEEDFAYEAIRRKYFS